MVLIFSGFESNIIISQNVLTLYFMLIWGVNEGICIKEIIGTKLNMKLLHEILPR